MAGNGITIPGQEISVALLVGVTAVILHQIRGALRHPAEGALLPLPLSMRARIVAEVVPPLLVAAAVAAGITMMFTRLALDAGDAPMASQPAALGRVGVVSALALVLAIGAGLRLRSAPIRGWMVMLAAPVALLGAGLGLLVAVDAPTRWAWPLLASVLVLGLCGLVMATVALARWVSLRLEKDLPLSRPGLPASDRLATDLRHGLGRALAVVAIGGGASWAALIAASVYLPLREITQHPLGGALVVLPILPRVLVLPDVLGLGGGAACHAGPWALLPLSAQARARAITRHLTAVALPAAAVDLLALAVIAQIAPDALDPLLLLAGVAQFASAVVIAFVLWTTGVAGTLPARVGLAVTTAAVAALCLDLSWTLHAPTQLMRAAAPVIGLLLICAAARVVRDMSHPAMTHAPAGEAREGFRT